MRFGVIAYIVLSIVLSGLAYWVARNAEGVPSDRGFYPPDHSTSEEFPTYTPLQLSTDEITNDLKARAAAGDAQAQFELALLLASEFDDHREYADLLMKSAEAGNAAAATEVGTAYFNGDWGLPRDVAAAADWYGRAAAAGDEVALWALGNFYRDGVGVVRDDAHAADLFLRSAKKGYPAAQYAVYLILREGVGVARDEERAAEALGAALDQEYGPEHFASDNFRALDGSILGGFENAVSRFGADDEELGLRLRCAAISNDVTAVHQKLSFEQATQDKPEVAADPVASGDNFLRELVEGGDKRSKSAYEETASRFALMRISALFGDPVGQARLSEMWRRRADDPAAVAEAGYWSARSARNPLGGLFPEICTTRRLTGRID